MCGIRIHLDAVGIRITQHMAGIFHDGQLHAQAKSQERKLMRAGILDSSNHTFDTTGAEAAGNQNALYIRQKFCHIVLCDCFGIDPFNIHSCMVGNATVFQCLYYRDISIMKLDIFSYQSYRYLLGGVTQIIHHLFPFG